MANPTNRELNVIQITCEESILFRSESLRESILESLVAAQRTS